MFRDWDTFDTHAILRLNNFLSIQRESQPATRNHNIHISWHKESPPPTQSLPAQSSPLHPVRLRSMAPCSILLPSPLSTLASRCSCYRHCCATVNVVAALSLPCLLRAAPPLPFAIHWRKPIRSHRIHPSSLLISSKSVSSSRFQFQGSHIGRRKVCRGPERHFFLSENINLFK